MMAGGAGGGVGAAGLGTLLAAALTIAVMTAVLTGLFLHRWRKAEVERHIDDLYDEIRTKAVAAAAADYSGVPQPLFELLGTLHKKLGPLLDLGGSMGMGGMVDRIDKALNRATSFSSPKHPIPAHGASMVVQPNPPEYLTETKNHPSANSELEKAAREFNAFWDDGPYIKTLIRETLKKLGGDRLYRLF